MCVCVERQREKEIRAGKSIAGEGERERDGKWCSSHHRDCKLRLFCPPKCALLLPSRPASLAPPPSPKLSPFSPLTQHQKLNPLLFAFPLAHLSLSLVNHLHPPTHPSLARRVPGAPPYRGCCTMERLSLLQCWLRVIELSLSFDFRTSCERVGLVLALL